MKYRYKKIRLKNGKTKDQQRIVYESHHGEIPQGMVVHHVNGDRYDNNIENLVLMSRAEHASFHAKRQIRKITIKHGTTNTYKKHKCRCSLCRMANRDAVRRWRGKMKGVKFVTEEV